MLTTLDDRIQQAPPTGPEVAELWAVAYDELKQLARARLRRSGPSTLLDTTGLVNEAYLRLARIGRLPLAHRGQFFAYSARVMRSVVIDMVRRARADGRSGGDDKLTLDTAAERVQAGEDDPLRINEALEELARVDERLAQVVEMRYFGGYTDAEIGQALGLTDRTVRRDWDRARTLLHAMLSR